MCAFGGIITIFQYVGLYIQLNAALSVAVDEDVDNRLSGNTLFTEVPHDITTQSGEDVEMACSFRGVGSAIFSLEIQWWYIKNQIDWQEKSEQTTNHVVPPQEISKEATKISVVKVAGSNISHKLRLSSVKPSDEGTYECRVIDFSGTVAQHHRVHAYLQVKAKSHSPEDVQWKQQVPEEAEPRELKRRSTECSESCAL